ncbi:MAG: methyltransferase domain-containing protein [Planctomycetaceae bacterium]
MRERVIPAFSGDSSRREEHGHWIRSVLSRELAGTGRTAGVSAQFLSGKPLHEPCDVVVSRHVIEHIPQPVEFLSAIRDRCQNSSEARVFIETAQREWILRSRTYWDFFHEHCSIFTDASLTTACERVGLAVPDVRHVFGGQYLWLEATPAEGSQ